MNSFSFTKQIRNLLVFTVGLFGFNYAFGAEPTTHNQLSNQSNQINKIAYPKTALDNNVEGRVVVYFELLDGTANNVVVIQTEDSMLNETAIEIVNDLSIEYLLQLQETGKTGFLLPVNFDII